MKRKKLIESITGKLNSRYAGVLNCEEQRADLFVYIDKIEQTIKVINTKEIIFENSEHNVELEKAELYVLVYIDSVI